MRSKRIVGLILLMIGLLICPQVAKADVIWEPQDSFYERHVEDCRYINRSYTANGPNGKVVVYESPESANKVITLENGTAMYISYVYTGSDGIEWAIYEKDGVTGWMPMEYLEVIYDYISFEEEYGDQIINKEGQLESSYIEQQIYLWAYPGSERGHQIKMADLFAYDSVFVDEQGREWGYSAYYYGNRNIWVCLDDPTADFDTLYPEEAPARGVNSKENEYNSKEILPDNSTQMKVLVFITVLVVLVVVITLVLLGKLRNGRPE